MARTMPLAARCHAEAELAGLVELVAECSAGFEVVPQLAEHCARLCPCHFSHALTYHLCVADAAICRRIAIADSTTCCVACHTNSCLSHRACLCHLC